MQNLIQSKPSRILLAIAAVMLFIKEVRERVVAAWNMVPVGIRHSFIGSFCAIALVSMVLYFSLVEFMTLLMFKVLTILILPSAPTD
jgi:predicted CDP-diglyceride synthetase/phosphatidate cytidylyltransferase